MSNIISSRAEYRRDHYFFPRTQSPAVRNTPWASRRAQTAWTWAQIGEGALAFVVGLACLCVLLTWYAGL